MVPRLLQPIYSTFPLVTYPAPEPAYSSLPARPTLWVLSDTSSSSSTESLDPGSRTAQALARFLGVQVHSVGYGEEKRARAPGEKFPSLWLPNGDLLSHEQTNAELFKLAGVVTAESLNGAGGGTTEKEKEALLDGYLALLRGGLEPAVRALVALRPAHTSDGPVLRRLLGQWTAVANQAALAEEVRVLWARAGKGGGKGKGALDLERMEDDAVEVLKTIEVLVRETLDGGKKWLLGSRHATPLDAELYALLSILLDLQTAGTLKAGDSVLLGTLLKADGLTSWTRDRGP